MHLEILDENQLLLLSQIGTFASSNGFYLGGGTAVALYYGHRKSIDFDWFADAQIDDPILLAEKARRSGLEISDPQIAPGTLHALINSVRVSFFQYPYPLIAGLTHWPEYNISLASLDDLACMKLAAIAQRGSKKDFIDMYILANEHLDLKRSLELYRQKYSTNDISHVLLGLTYFDDAESEPLPVMLKDIPWEEIKAQFRSWAQNIAG